MSNPSGPPKQRGCLFYGCLSLSILAVLILVCVGVGIYFANQKFKAMVSEYTSPTPDKIEQRPYAEPKLQELRTRLGAFDQAAGKEPKSLELILSADDLNALIAEEKDLKGKVFVELQDDQIKGQVSYPLKDIGPFKLKGRYLNGTAAFKVGLANGALDLRLESIAVKNKPIPPVILNELNKQNLAKDAQNDPKVANVMSRIESFEIRDSKVYIRSKPGTSPPVAPAQP